MLLFFPGLPRVIHHGVLTLSPALSLLSGSISTAIMSTPRESPCGMGTGKWRQEKEVRSAHHAKPPTDGARPARALGTIRSPQGHWEPPGRALGKELQSDKEVWGSWETNPHFPSPLWGKMVLEGNLLLPHPAAPSFWALLPSLAAAATSSRKSSQMPSAWARHHSPTFP